MNRGSPRGERPSHLSRNVALGSAAVIALLVAYLTLQAFRNGSPAVIEIEIVAEQGWTSDSLAYVPVDVRNAGGSTAADIEIETAFRTPVGEPIVKRTRIDFLAEGERRRIYAAGPRGGEVTGRVIGFREP